MWLTDSVKIVFAFLLNAIKHDTHFVACAGNIPKELGALHKLQRLSIHSNQLSGECCVKTGGVVIFHRVFVR